MPLQYTHLKVVKIVSNKILIQKKKVSFTDNSIQASTEKFFLFPLKKTTYQREAREEQAGEEKPTNKRSLL